MPTITKHEKARRKNLNGMRTAKKSVVLDKETGIPKASQDSIAYWNELLRREGLGMGKSVCASGSGDKHNLLVYSDKAEVLGMQTHKPKLGHGPDC